MQIPEPVFTDSARDALRQFLSRSNYNHAVILCDANTRRFCLPLLESDSYPVIEIPVGESAKTMDTVLFVAEEMLKHGCSRNSVLVNLGGGVVTDLGGFAASVFRRGIPFVHIPTTLLAMADAAIGGKTGVDFKHLKNYIGTFAQAEAVIISTEFLATLDEAEMRSARAEIIKTAIVSDKHLFSMVMTGALDKDTLERCAMAKHRLVVKDPFDHHVRQLLNFGHTIGHAYESYKLESGEQVKHGLAIAKGMLAETGIACRLNMITPEEKYAIEHAIKSICVVENIETHDFERLLPYLVKDKKNSGQEPVFRYLQVLETDKQV